MSKWYTWYTGRINSDTVNNFKLCLSCNRLKDGLPAAEMCARYRIRSYTLTIKHVAEEDAGNYTILLSTQQWNLHKNLTVTLRVNGELVA